MLTSFLECPWKYVYTVILCPVLSAQFAFLVRMCTHSCNLHFRRSLSLRILAAFASFVLSLSRPTWLFGPRAMHRDFNWRRIVAWNSLGIWLIVSGFLFLQLEHLHLYARYSYKFLTRFPDAWIIAKLNCYLTEKRIGRR